MHDRRTFLTMTVGTLAASAVGTQAQALARDLEVGERVDRFLAGKKPVA